jgi:hypothetical protein
VGASSEDQSTPQAAALVAVAYPLVYLAFEWVLYYSVKPVSRA